VNVHFDHLNQNRHDIGIMGILSLSCFLIDEKEFGALQGDIIRHLESHYIESLPVWKPLHTQPLFKGYECVGGEVAENLNRRGDVCLVRAVFLRRIKNE